MQSVICSLQSANVRIRLVQTSYIKQLNYSCFCHMINILRLVFTSDGVIVGVVIRRVEQYDLVKIKPTESEAEH